MKRIFYFISILFCTLFFAERIEAVSISKDKALTMVRQQFSDKDVDYFILNEYLIGENDPYDSNNWWTFFVDADPMKGWEHECYIVNVSNLPQGMHTETLVSDGEIVTTYKFVK